MKYKLLKETPWIAEDSIIELDNGNIHITNDEYEQYREGKDYASETYDWILWAIKNHPEDFEEVKEIPEPRWKVGDSVVSGTVIYTKITTVRFVNSTYIYNGWLESNFRDPTPEELLTYFR